MISILAKTETIFSEYEYQWTSWNKVCLAYGVNNKQIHLVDTENFEDVLNSLDDRKKVFLEPPYHAKQTSYLHEYEHPDDCVYIFGNTQTSNLEYVKEGDDIVSVRMNAMSDSNVFGISIASIVLYDRMMKS